MNHAAEELALYVQNDGQLYKDETIPAQRRLARAKMAGTYQRGDAVNAFARVMSAGAAKHSREFPGGRQFTAGDRRQAAASFADYFEAEWDLGNMDHVLPDSELLVAARSRGVTGEVPRRRTPVAQLEREVAATVGHGRRGR